MKKLIPLGLIIILLLSACRGDVPPNTIHSPEHLYGRVIGVLEGSASVRFVDNLTGVRVFWDGEQMLTALRNGALDGVVMEEDAAQALISGVRGVAILDEPLIEYDLRVAVAKENTHLLAAVNSAISTLRADGTLDGLRDRYLTGQEFAYHVAEDIEFRPGYLRAAVPAHFPPYVFYDEEGELAGMDIEVLRAISNQMGVEFRIEAMAAEDLITAVWFGRADIAVGFIPENGEAMEEVSFSQPYARSTQAIIVRR